MFETTGTTNTGRAVHVSQLPKSLVICGMTYRIVIVKRGQRGPKEWTKRTEGMCDPNAGVIYLAGWLAKNPTRLRDTFVHEVAHALSEGTGLRRWLADIVPGGKRKRPTRAWRQRVWELEESVIRIMVPALIQALESGGLMEKWA